MNIHLPAPRRRWPARLVNLAVVVVVLALAAATFVLSYTGVHVIALQAGVSTRLARFYPATFDAVLVIACVAAVILRDARWWVRSYAWLVIILVVAVVGAADAVHAMNVVLRHRTMEGVVAATPWVLVLLGFSLMLTILQHSRAQHAAATPQTTRASRRAARRGAELAADVTPVHDTTPAPDATVVDVTPAVDVPAGVGDTPAADGGIATSADPHRYEDAAVTEPDQAAVAAEPTVSWHHYWDVPHEPDPGSQTYPGAAEGPEDQGQPSAPAESRDRSYLSAPAEAADRPYPSEAAQADSPGYRSQSAAGESDPDGLPVGTAPFATVPRLNRVRSTPTPPDEDED